MNPEQNIDFVSTSETVEAQRRAVTDTTQEHGVFESTSLSLLESISKQSWEDGFINTAIEIQEKVCERRDKAEGPTEYSNIPAFKFLAHMYSKTNQLRKAEVVFEKVLKMEKESAGQ